MSWMTNWNYLRSLKSLIFVFLLVWRHSERVHLLKVGCKTSGFVMMDGRFFSVFMHFQARLALFS